jgi:hypothetical protein
VIRLRPCVVDLYLQCRKTTFEFSCSFCSAFPRLELSLYEAVDDDGVALSRQTSGDLLHNVLLQK